MSAAIGQGKASEAALRATVRSNLDYLAGRGKVAKLGSQEAAAWELKPTEQPRI